MGLERHNLSLLLELLHLIDSTLGRGQTSLLNLLFYDNVELAAEQVGNNPSDHIRPHLSLENNFKKINHYLISN